MALTARTKRVLGYSLKSRAIGTEVAGIVDAGSGTLSAAARRRISVACGNRIAGGVIGDKIDAGTALTDWTKHHMLYMLKDKAASDEIIAALAAP